MEAPTKTEARGEGSRLKQTEGSMLTRSPHTSAAPAAKVVPTTRLSVLCVVEPRVCVCMTTIVVITAQTPVPLVISSTGLIRVSAAPMRTANAVLSAWIRRSLTAVER